MDFYDLFDPPERLYLYIVYTKYDLKRVLDMRWYGSLKVHIASVLGLQIILVIAMVGFTLYQLDLRKHDYAVLNLSGRLSIISQTLFTQSENYKHAAPRDYQSYNRDLNLYHKDLQKHLANYDLIIKAFEARNLSADLIGRNESIACKWDKSSTDQLTNTANDWYKFKAGLMQSIGDDEEKPRLEYAAEYIIDNGELIQKSSADLSSAFQIMMESKLDNIRLMNRVLLAGFIIINLFLLVGFIYKVFRPLDKTRKSFDQVANGNLNHQVIIESKNEIGDLTQSFNRLTERLAALFRLTDRVHQASNLDESLKFFYQEFKVFLHIDWVGLIRYAPGTNDFSLDRLYTDGECELYENEKFHSDESILQMAADSHRPVIINQLATAEKTELLNKLQQCQMKSVLAIPLESLSKDVVILLLAARNENAYQQQHLELLENISAQLSHSLDKTIGMEGLVISTIEGLAKLAESRDPETGDHLTRMSLYSALIAEQLSKESIYSEQITTAYIRDVFRFAPMHDIGKVGIEDRILLKPGRLTDDERHEMEKHPVIGANVLRRCENQMNALGHSVFKVGIEIAESHHEKYDGSGYPNKLSGADIPLSARIVAVADVFDALTSRRPYKEAWQIEKALKVMKEDAGKHFDPVIIGALQQAMPKVMEIYNTHKHI